MRVAASEVGLLLLAFVAMALSIAVDHGHYSPRALALLLASAGFLSAAARRSLTDQPADRLVIDCSTNLERLFAVGLVSLLIFGAFDWPGFSLRSVTFRHVFIVAQCGLAAAVTAVFLSPWTSARARQVVVIAGVIGGFALRVGMVMASPSPEIDVFTQFQESAAHLLHGLNPYTTPVSDPYAGRLDFGYHVTGYSYPPAGLYLQTAAFALTGDVRYAYIAFEALAVASLYAIAVGRPGGPGVRQTGSAALLVLLFLYHPRGLFEIEQAWNEPLLVGCAGVFLWLACVRPGSRWVSLVFGLLLSVKQYLVFFALLWFAPRHRWRRLPVVAAVVLATWIPFLIWDPASAVTNGLLFQFHTPFRPDGLTLTSAAHQWLGWTSTKWYAIMLGTAVAIWLGWIFRERQVNGASGISGWLYASTLTTLVVFLTGSQAFANYYYFLGALILFLMAIRLRETSVVLQPLIESGK